MASFFFFVFRKTTSKWLTGAALENQYAEIYSSHVRSLGWARN